MLKELSDEFTVTLSKEFKRLSETDKYFFNPHEYDRESISKLLNEKGVDTKTGKVLVEVSPEYFRPTDVEFLLGDASKAKKNLGWKPRVCFEELVKLMVKADVEKVKK